MYTFFGVKGETLILSFLLMKISSGDISLFAIVYCFNFINRGIDCYNQCF